MELQTIHIREKHIRLDSSSNPIDTCAYNGNCQPGHKPEKHGAYQQGGHQWRTHYDCDKRTWIVNRSEGAFEAVGELNIYLDKWLHKRKIEPVKVRFDQRTMTARIIK